MAATQRTPEGSAPPPSNKTRKTSMNEMFAFMASGFLRGGTGFGELLKTTVPQEVRVGVTQVGRIRRRKFQHDICTYETLYNSLI